MVTSAWKNELGTTGMFWYEDCHTYTDPRPKALISTNHCKKYLKLASYKWPQNSDYKFE
jgi:hypothetical protein